MHKPLPRINVWKNQNWVNIDALTQEEKVRVRDRIVEVWTKASQDHFLELQRKYKTSGKN